MKIGDKIIVTAEVTGWNDDLGCFVAAVTDPDWFLDESGFLMQKSKHWRNPPR